MISSELIAVLAASGTVVTAIGAIWSLLQRRQIAERQRQITEQFTRAIDQLGHAQLDVRVGGIYALERIARDSPADRATIEEVLTAFVRSHAPWPPRLPGQYVATAPIDEVPELQVRAPDVQAAMTVLGRRKPPSTGQRLDLHNVDLRKADLKFADLQGAILAGADLQGAILAEAQLQGAILAGADLRGANLAGAELQGAILAEAQLQGAILAEAQLQGANLAGAELQDANLAEADLRGAFLGAARLHGAFLSGAHLQDAYADVQTTWPEGFDWQLAGATIRFDTLDGDGSQIQG
jgi:Pentapeptide repeats (8 copies)